MKKTININLFDPKRSLLSRLNIIFLVLTSIYFVHYIFFSVEAIANLPWEIANGSVSDANKIHNNYSYLGNSADSIYQNSLKSGVVPGAVFPFPGDIIPSGFLECNGQEASRQENPSLFSAIGTRYGDGDGVTTFNVPNYQGYFLRGWDHNAKRDPDADSRIGGDSVGAIQKDQFKSHAHSITEFISNNDLWKIKIPCISFFGGCTTNRYQILVSSVDIIPDPYLGSIPFSGELISDNLLGSKYGIETRPKNIYVRYIIKSN